MVIDKGEGAGLGIEGQLGSYLVIGIGDLPCAIKEQWIGAAQGKGGGWLGVCVEMCRAAIWSWGLPTCHDELEMWFSFWGGG
jgi:hypothetical protein